MYLQLFSLMSNLLLFIFPVILLLWKPLMVLYCLDVIQVDKKNNSNCFGLISFVCLLFLYCKFQTTHDVLRYAANYILFFWKETPNMGCFSNLFINHKTKRKANKIVRIICYINQALHSMYEQMCIFWIPGSGVIKHILGKKPGGEYLISLKMF